MKLIPTADSTPDVVLDWLHEEGWSMVHTHLADEWNVTGVRGTQQITAQGKTLEEAWLRATEAARQQEPSLAKVV